MFRRTPASIRTHGGQSGHPTTATQPAQPTLAQRAQQGTVKIVIGLSAMLSNWRGMKRVMFEDEVLVATTGGSTAFGKTTLTAEGDPQAIADLQRELASAQQQVALARQDVEHAREIAEREAQQAHNP